MCLQNGRTLPSLQNPEEKSQFSRHSAATFEYRKTSWGCLNNKTFYQRKDKPFVTIYISNQTGEEKMSEWTFFPL